MVTFKWKVIFAYLLDILRLSAMAAESQAISDDVALAFT